MTKLRKRSEDVSSDSFYHRPHNCQLASKLLNILRYLLSSFYLHASFLNLFFSILFSPVCPIFIIIIFFSIIILIILFLFYFYFFISFFSIIILFFPVVLPWTLKWHFRQSPKTEVFETALRSGEIRKGRLAG